MPVSQQADILILYNRYIQYSKDTKIKGTRLVSTEDGARIQKETKDISLNAIWYKSYFQYGKSCRNTQGHPDQDKGNFTAQRNNTMWVGYACTSTGSRKEEQRASRLEEDWKRSTCPVWYWELSKHPCDGDRTGNRTQGYLVHKRPRIWLEALNK